MDKDQDEMRRNCRGVMYDGFSDADKATLDHRFLEPRADIGSASAMSIGFDVE